MPLTITPALLAENRDIAFTDFLQELIIHHNNIGLTEFEYSAPTYLLEAEREAIKAELISAGFLVTEVKEENNYIWTIDWGLTA